MTLWLLVPFLALAAIVQTAWLPLLSVFGYKVDLALVLVVLWGLVGPIGQAAQWGFIVGIFLDLTSGLPFGLHTLALTVIGFLVGWSQTTFFRGNIITPPATLMAATLSYNVLILAFLSLFGWRIVWQDYLLRVTLPTAILNAVVAPLAYFPLQWLQRRLYPRMEL